MRRKGLWLEGGVLQFQCGDGVGTLQRAVGARPCEKRLPATGVIWALPGRKLQIESENGFPGPPRPRGPKSPKRSRKRVKIVEN